MWSVGGAALLAIVLAAGAVTLALWRARAEISPALRSFAALHDDVRVAIERADRDAGRARASQQVLVRHGHEPPPR